MSTFTFRPDPAIAALVNQLTFALANNASSGASGLVRSGVDPNTAVNIMVHSHFAAMASLAASAAHNCGAAFDPEDLVAVLRSILATTPIPAAEAQALCERGAGPVN